MTKREEFISSAEYRETLTRLPQLGNTVIRANIGTEIQKLKNAPAWLQAEGRSSETLVKYEDHRVVLVAMKAESRMCRHRRCTAGASRDRPCNVCTFDRNLGCVRWHHQHSREDFSPDAAVVQRCAALTGSCVTIEPCMQWQLAWEMK